MPLYNITLKLDTFFHPSYKGTFLQVKKAVLEPQVSSAFAITYFCNHCNEGDQFKVNMGEKKINF